MAIYFISDLHLCSQRPEIVEVFERFLDDISNNAESLYILGDMFEAWIGDDYYDPGVAPAITALKEFSTSCPSYIMHGNRDFLLGHEFESQTGCSLLDDEVVIDLLGTNTLLMHGDTLCTDDIQYQTVRKTIRDDKWKTHVLTLSIEERLSMAKQFRMDSDSSKDAKSETIMDVNQAAVEAVMSKHNVSQLIHGHTHRPNLHQFSIDGKACKRYVLADWYEQGSALVADKSGIKVVNLTPY